MSLIDDIRRDREAGTPGPWGFGNTGEDGGLILGDGGKDGYVTRVQIWQTPRAHGLWEEDSREANARRIARVPEMEAALLAAEELAKKADAAFQMIEHWEGKGNSRQSVDLRAALTAFQKAVK